MEVFDLVSKGGFRFSEIFDHKHMGDGLLVDFSHS